jgi:hypothetical protein
LREDRALLGADVRAGVHPDALRAWAAAPIVLHASWARCAAPALAAAAVGGSVLWAFGYRQPLAAIAALEAVVARALRRRVQHVVHAPSPPGLRGRSIACPLQHFDLTARQ